MSKQPIFELRKIRKDSAKPRWGKDRWADGRMDGLVAKRRILMSNCQKHRFLNYAKYVRIVPNHVTSPAQGRRERLPPPSEKEGPVGPLR